MNILHSILKHFSISWSADNFVQLTWIWEELDYFNLLQKQWLCVPQPLFSTASSLNASQSVIGSAQSSNGVCRYVRPTYFLRLSSLVPLNGDLTFRHGSPSSSIQRVILSHSDQSHILFHNLPPGLSRSPRRPPTVHLQIYHTLIRLSSSLLLTLSSGYPPLSFSHDQIISTSVLS